MKEVSGFYWIQGMRNHCHCQWHKPTTFTVAACCGTTNSTAQLRGEALCRTFIFIAVISPRRYLYSIEKLTALMCIIVTTFTGNSFPNRWCKSATLLLGIFCRCIFRRPQGGLSCLHMPIMPCVESSWIWIWWTPQMQNGKRVFTWQQVYCSQQWGKWKAVETPLERIWLLGSSLAPRLFLCAVLYGTGHRSYIHVGPQRGFALLQCQKERQTERRQERTLNSTSFAPQGLSVASLSLCCPDNEQQALHRQIQTGVEEEMLTEE